MSNEASNLFATGFLSGFFDVVATMVSPDTSFELDTAAPLDADSLATLLEHNGGVLQTTIQEGGAIALLLPAFTAYAIAKAFMGEGPEPQDPVAASDCEHLKEVYDPFLGAGAGFFKEKYGKVISLRNMRVREGGPAAAQGIKEFIGDHAVRADFHYSIPPDIQGQGALLFTANLSEIIPEEAVLKASTEGGQALDQSELDDILGNVGIPKAAPAPKSNADEHRSGGHSTFVPPNLDMVLDIRLVVKARLGRVEMPIAEILALGPGSIIEVGHMVDEPIELLVNDKLIARGDVVVVDEKFGLRITEIVSTKERIESLR